MLVETEQGKDAEHPVELELPQLPMIDAARIEQTIIETKITAFLIDASLGER